MRKFLSLLFSSVLLAASLTALSSTSAVAETTLVTCTDLVTQKTIILKANQKSCKPLHATAIWHIEKSDSPAHSGAGYASLRTCTSKRTQFNYQLLKSKCTKYQNTNDYWHTITPLEIPIITSASARGYDGATFALAATKQNIDAPIAYYLITNIKTGQINKVSPNNAGVLSLSNLSSLTSYTFTIAAVSVDGTSLFSSITPVITTGAVPVVVVAPAVAPIAAPAFTLSSASETKTASNAIAGYTITSSGGAIASYSISPAAPAGLTFSTSTGLLSGTPTSAAVATTYTITATNASGSAIRTFTLTVTAVIVYTVGQTGPGGGKVFYVATTPFACGPTRATTCSYLEAAPTSGTNAWTDAAYEWSGNTSFAIGATAQGAVIGTGFSNTIAIVDQAGGGSDAGKAGTASRGYGGPNNLNDWFLPSEYELKELYSKKADVGGFVTGPFDFYWSSTETFPFSLNFDDGAENFLGKSESGYVRPVRAF